VSNPGDRWRRAWLLPAVLLGVVAVGGGIAIAQVVDDTTVTPLPQAALAASDNSGATTSDVQVGWAVDGGRIQLIGAVTDAATKTALAEAAIARFGAGNVDDQLFVSPEGQPKIPRELIAGLDSIPTDGRWILAWDGSNVRLQGTVGTGADRDAIRGVADAVGTVATDEITVENAPAESTPEAPADTAAPVGAPVDDATVSTIETPPEANAVTDPINAEPAAEPVAEPVVDDSVVVPDTTPPTVPNTTVPETTVPATTVPDTTPTTTAEATAEEVAVIEEIRADLQLEGIEFSTGSANIRPESRDVLDRVAATLLENPTVRVEVGGHTDNIGDPAFNQTLSAARASSVVAYLVNKGIDAERLTSKGYGQDKPLVPNDSSANRRQNRRIEFTII
jgi:outer membrane protein OmpA-like peptidoglycan-associated protein